MLNSIVDETRAVLVERDVKVLSQEKAVILPKEASKTYDQLLASTDNGIMAFYSSHLNSTDIFEASYDQFGHLRLRHLHSFRRRLISVIAKGDKIVCDNVAFTRRPGHEGGGLGKAETLDVDSMSSACFICEEFIVISMDHASKFVTFVKTAPNQPYKKLQLKSSTLKVCMKSVKAENLRQCRFEPDCFYAIVKKDLVKVRFSDIQRTERPTKHDIIFRADRV